MKPNKGGKFNKHNKIRHGSALPKTRKEVRKARRKLKKVAKKEHVKFKPQASGNAPGKFVRAPLKEENNDSENITRVQSGPKRNKVTFTNIVQEERRLEKEEQMQLVSDIASKRKELLIKANEEEELTIKKLEKQLGLKKMKSKNKTKNFAGDGLDYLLEICDRASLEQSAAAEKYLAEMEPESDFDEDIAIASGKQPKIKKNAKKTKMVQEAEFSASDGDDFDNDDLAEDESQSKIDEHYDYNNEELDDDESVDCNSGHSTGGSGLSEEDESQLKFNEPDDDDNDDEMDEDDDGSQSMEESGLSEDEETDEESEELSNLAEFYTTESKKRKIDTDEQISKKKVKSASVNITQSDDSIGGDDCDNDNDDNDGGESKGFWEDIYGRKRDKDGNVLKEESDKYIPPHLRNQSKKEESQEIIQLKRQMKSVLNKLAGGNIHWACSSIEQLYNQNSRNAVNSALCDLWSSAIIQATLSPARMVAEHAVLIAVLHANVGTEIGAHFLQTLVKMLDSMIKDQPSLDDKRLENLVSTLSYLYNFKIFHAMLLFEILGKLMEDITEKHIECVLIALRNIGGVLRKDEPAQLKSFIHEVQSKTTQISDQAASGSRIKFLMDVLLAIKNNNLTKIPNYDPSYAEELKKSMKAIVRRGNYVTPLNIKMDDLLKADERGKWWVVGSAWNGSLDNQTRDSSATGPKTPGASLASKKLLELARQQRMNTEIRKNIFCIIMAAEDYMDAFEKLLHLGLKNQQERDIIFVLIACCLQEKRYNPYYSVLAQKFCEYDRKFQLSIQYAVWDKLKDINNFTPSQLINLAQFLSHLFTEKSLPLSVLKVVHFSELSKPTLRLMRQILLSILLHNSQETCLEVFQRVAVSPKLHMFRESLKLFIRHFLLKNLTKDNSKIESDKKGLLEERSSLVDKILSSSDSKLRF